MAIMDDLGKALGGANINTKDIEKLAKNVGIDASKGADLLGMLGGGKIDERSLAGLTSKVEPDQLKEITQFLSKIDFKKLDVNAIAKQFNVPADVIKQLIGMLKK